MALLRAFHQWGEINGTYDSHGGMLDSDEDFANAVAYHDDEIEALLQPSGPPISPPTEKDTGR